METMHQTPHEIDCRTAAERLWEYLDGEGEVASMAQVEAHLAACQECPPHFDFARTLLRGVRAVGGRTPDKRRLRALQVRVVEVLRAQGYQEVGA